jgi:hypothetical protein
MPTDSTVSRREFLKTTAMKTAGVAALGTMTFLPHPERVFGATKRVRVAIGGLHGCGKDRLAAYSRLSDVEIAALCDVDENVLRKRLGEVGGKPKTYVGVRKLLEDRPAEARCPPGHWPFSSRESTLSAVQK